MLVLLVNPWDPQVQNPTLASDHKPEFGIVQIVLDKAGVRYDERRCVVKHGGKTSILPVGQLIPLLELSPGDARALTADEAFIKRAAEIVKKRAFQHMPPSQRNFLLEVISSKRG
ncbi:MAG: hypothetical protein A2940_00985 [Candidatus Wildermuthbacteria bacterium RIFCSPLOWO2_01_FULL_48_29]|nr:MAG: hypothetical protein A2940_00985 [Candidatus Wildermuthbacteria bacterium RIFCSPLOWO2_01_FULL_48_29]